MRSTATEETNKQHFSFKFVGQQACIEYNNFYFINEAITRTFVLGKQYI